MSSGENTGRSARRLYRMAPRYESSIFDCMDRHPMPGLDPVPLRKISLYTDAWINNYLNP